MPPAVQEEGRNVSQRGFPRLYFRLLCAAYEKIDRISESGFLDVPGEVWFCYESKEIVERDDICGVIHEPGNGFLGNYEGMQGDLVACDLKGWKTKKSPISNIVVSGQWCGPAGSVHGRSPRLVLGVQG